MSRPRQYMVVPSQNVDGCWGFALLGECVRPTCGRVDGRWGDGSYGESACGHFDYVPGWWPTRELAIRQMILWRQKQQLLLDNGFEIARQLVPA